MCVISKAIDIKGNFDSDYALKEWKIGSGKNDHAKIRELVHVLRNIGHPNTTDENEVQSELDQLDNNLIKQAGDIVSNRIELIHGIGDLLFQKVKEYNVKYELTETEINEVKNIKEI